MKWKVFLNGHLNDFGELCSVINLDKILILKEEDRYFLYYDEFENKETDTEVKNIANKLIKNINGIATLRNVIRQPIELDYIKLNLKNKVSYKDLSGKVGFTGKVKPDLQVFNKEGKGIIGKPTSDSIAEDVIKSLNNKKINTLFEIILKEKYKWIKLYQILEFIQKDLRGKQDEQIIKKGWSNKKELRRFRNTATDPNEIGLDSRHIKREGKTSKDKPMTLYEAEIFINKIANKWLNEKLK